MFISKNVVFQTFKKKTDKRMRVCVCIQLHTYSVKNYKYILLLYNIFTYDIV